MDLVSLTIDGLKYAVKQSLESRKAARADRAELQEGYELALRLLGVLLYECHENVEYVRLMGSPKGNLNYAPLHFMVSDAVVSELCRVAPNPALLEACRAVLAALKRVDFFQREGARASIEKRKQPDGSVESDQDRIYGIAWGFADDALNRGRLLERFNFLVKYGNETAATIFEASEWKDGGTGLFPDRIDPEARNSLDV
jgi:hypothetical protein